jgi:hypothetical protein
VAVSGGGHRAALFGLGSLLYLTEAGLNTDVSSIASVSGGSMTNGVLVRDTDFNTETSSTLVAKTSNLVHRCAHTGTVQWTTTVKLALSAAVLAVLALLAGLVIGVLQWTWGPPHWHSFGAWLSAGGLVAATVAVQSFSLLADRAFAAQLYGTTTMGDLTANPVTHVFCSTELQSKLHVYFSPRFAYGRCFDFSTTDARNLRLSTAVQASACFPPVFPPRRLWAKKYGFPKNSSWRLWLSDGGVYDNMGDEWARGFWDAAQKHQAFSKLGEPPQRLLVVNASGESTPKSSGLLARVPLVNLLLSLVAESNVMYQQTTATRRFDMVAQFDLVRQLEAAGIGEPAAAGQAAQATDPIALDLRLPIGGTLVHIATTAAWPLYSKSPPPGCDPVRFADVKQKLKEFGQAAELDAARDSSKSVSTTLAALGADKSAALLWHGYMLTMVNFATFGYGPWEPKQLDEFVALVADSGH